MRVEAERLLNRLALLGVVFGVAGVGTVNAAAITFESPTYTAGNLSSTYNTTGPWPFTAQDGWSQASSTELGNIASYASVGGYVGGQALTTHQAAGDTTTTVTYSGAKSGFTLVGGGGFSFDAYSGRSQGELGVAGWIDSDANNALNNVGSEIQLQVGFVASAGQKIGIRDHAAARIPTSATAAANHWYHFVATLNDSTRTVTLNVTDLTTNSVVDLNGAAAGTAWSTTLTAATYGASSNLYGGVYARTSGNSAIDNIQPIPEPAMLGLVALSGIGLMAGRRRICAH